MIVIRKTMSLLLLFSSFFSVYKGVYSGTSEILGIYNNTALYTACPPEYRLPFEHTATRINSRPLIRPQSS